MKVLFYLVLSLCLIVLQTTLIPDIGIFSCCFDLLIINVLYVSLFISHPMAIGYVVLLGWFMDSLSGAPFGFYLSVYLWTFGIVQLLKNVVQPGNLVFIPLVSALAVFIEQGFVVFVLVIRQEGGSVSSDDIMMLLVQILIGFVFIPPALWLVQGCHRGWQKILRRMAGKQLGNRG